MTTYPIDFVVLWVDCTDPHWQKDYAYWKNKIQGTDINLNNKRYRDWGLLPYWFRAVEAYAPWVRKVHIVTCGHYPVWLNREHPKIHLVRHSDIMDAEDLPTFNSEAIEVNVNKIEGLAEHFVYFNDDFYLNAPVTPDFFFHNGLPRDIAASLRWKPVPGIHMDTVVCNNMKLVNSHFSKKKVLLERPGNWFRVEYGRLLLHTLYTLFNKEFAAMNEPHLNLNLLKSCMDEMWEKCPEVLKRTSQSKFRDDADVNSWVFRNWQLAANNFYPTDRLKDGVLFADIKKDLDKVIKTLSLESKKVVVINDDGNSDDFEQIISRLHEAYTKKLPNKSRFEY